MNSFFRFILKNRLLFFIVMIGTIIYGIYHYRNLQNDAFPDISPVMVPVFAEVHGMAPEEVERLITFPIESAMNGLPGVKIVKSTSAFGMAVVYVYFKDNVDIYFARQIVAERLANVSSELPRMEKPPTLGPISTGLGEVFMYYLTADSTVNTEGKDRNTWLRELNDWVIKFQLQTVPGVTEILSMGGHVLQYQVNLDPNSMHKYDVSYDDIIDAVQKNNGNAGGQFLVLGAEEYLVRGIGLAENKEHLRNIQIKVFNGIPVLLQDVASVDFGNEVRRGVVTLNGKDEVVAGIVIKLYGENTSKVISRLDKKFEEVKQSLPKGVELVPYYNQSSLVNKATGTVKKALIEGAILVIIVLLFFLGNIRAAIIVTISLPICALFAVIFMGIYGMSANLMTLGGVAIAIGLLADASIVIVENIVRQLGETKNSNKSKFLIIQQACTEVAWPLLASMAIIIVVFLPLFTLEGVEGKMFAPMAFTICFALFGSIITALVFSPILASLVLKNETERPLRVMNFLIKLYNPLLKSALRHRKVYVLITGVVFVATVFLIPFLGTEFIPTLEEGVVQINITMAPSISLEKAKETVLRLEKEIQKIGPVDKTLSKIGRPEAGSHPHPVNTGHIQIMLKPKKEWGVYKNKAQIIDTLNKKLAPYPGISLNFTQPIQNMFDELLSGVRTQLAVKVFGDDLEVLKTQAEEIKETIEGIPGLVDLSVEQSFGQPQVQIIADRDACIRYGVNINDILEIVELAVGGETVDHIFVNTRRFGIQVRLSEQFRNTPESIGEILVKSSEGYTLPLSQIATIKEVIGPIQINRENNQRRWTVSANVRGRDMGSVVKEMQERIHEKIKLPSGYFIEIGGQFENQQRAMRRLMIIVPTAFILIFLILYLSLRSWGSSLLIFTNVPFALIGGVLGLFIFREYLSIPASVGFIALFGIAVQNGLILVTYINQLRQNGLSVHEAILEGAKKRLRPVLMTKLTTIAGLLPLLFANGIGAEVQRPLAVVVVFGLLSSTFLTLVLIPALYEWFSPKLEQSTEKIQMAEVRT